MSLRTAKILFTTGGPSAIIIVTLLSYTPLKLVFMAIGIFFVLLMYRVTVLAFHSALRDVASAQGQASLRELRVLEPEPEPEHQTSDRAQVR
jgi:hypothetical protein